MLVSEFDYNLPEERIAKFPPEVRGTTRLMVIDRDTRNIEHKKYGDIVDYIDRGDVVVLNYTKVQKVRTRAVVDRTGREVEVMFLENVQFHQENLSQEDKHNNRLEYWYCLIGRARHVKVGDILKYSEGETLNIVTRPEGETGFIVRINNTTSGEIFDKYGTVPLPPYMHRKAEQSDEVRYNTVFAKQIGSVAAPTASLNLTNEILDKIKKKGANIVYIELKIGWGTFAPVTVENTEDVVIHKESYNVSNASADTINESIKHGGKVWAFGTTTARVLESVGVIINENKGSNGIKAVESDASENRKVIGGSGETSIFISPGYKWKIVDRLVTNFHVPQSTLLMMVSAFADRDLIMEAYELALKEKYNFLSYGDSMVIIRNK